MKSSHKGYNESVERYVQFWSRNKGDMSPFFQYLTLSKKKSFIVYKTKEDDFSFLL